MSSQHLSATAWPAAMIVWGPGAWSSPHRHHCVQLLLVTSGKLRIRSGPHRDWIECGAVFIRPDAIHEVDSTGLVMLRTFVDVASELGFSLSAHIKADISPVGMKRVFGWRKVLGVPLSESRIKAWIRWDFVHKRGAASIHPAANKIVEHLRANIGSVEDSLSPHSPESQACRLRA